MLLENLRYYKEAANMTYEQLAVESKTPLSTVKNIFSGKNEPLVSTLQRIATALKVTLNDLLADSNLVLTSSSIIEVKESLEEVKVTLAETKENLAEVIESAEVVEAEKNLAVAELDALRARIAAQDTEIAVLKEKLRHKEELLAVYNYFTKIKTTE